MNRNVLRTALLLAAAMLIALTSIGATVGPASAADISVGSAEMEIARLINRDRARHGLVPIRLDSRLMAIAGARSRDMATRNYFSHVQPDGRNVFDLIAAARIRWYSAGEIIAWNNWPGMVDSASAANTGWMQSPGHRHIIMSRSYNYMGVGLALGRNGKRYWTAVFLRGPDRTSGWLRYAVPTVGASTVGARRVSFNWTGGDVRLSVLTSGFHSFQVQRRVDEGAWVTVRSATTVRSYALTVSTGHAVQLRIRVRDRAGNVGAWRYVTAAT